MEEGGSDNCYVTLEVLAEVCYVLEGLYQVVRKDIISSFRKLNNDMIILNVDILLRALEIFDKTPKLDFVDGLLYIFRPSLFANANGSCHTVISRLKVLTTLIFWC